MAKLLLVDDSQSIRDLFRITLEQDGHEIVCLKNAEEAITFAQNQVVDLVISDINMPGMSGIDLVTQLRKMSNYELDKLPILMLTVESSKIKKQESQTAGANGWLQKPFNAPLLKKTVSSILQKYNKN